MLNNLKLPPEGGRAPTSAVLILHGLGDSGQGVLGIGEELRGALPDTLFTAPDAPDPCEHLPFGFQWFSAQDWTPSVVLRGIQKAATPLNAYIDQIMKEYNLPASRIALLGFSQGTMMSLYVGPRRAEGLAGILGYSGALIGGETLAQERASNPPVLLVHGTRDEVLPFAAMDRARMGLENANMKVQTVSCEGLGHSIDARGIEEGALFLRRVLT